MNFNCDLFKSLHSTLNSKGRSSFSSLLRPLGSELTSLQEATDIEIQKKISKEGNVFLNGKSAQVNSEFIKFTLELSQVLNIHPYKAAAIIHAATTQKARYGDASLVVVAVLLYYTCKEYQLECIGLMLSNQEHLRNSMEISNLWLSENGLFNQILERLESNLGFSKTFEYFNPEILELVREKNLHERKSTALLTLVLSVHHQLKGFQIAKLVKKLQDIQVIDESSFIFLLSVLSSFTFKGIKQKF